MLELDLRQVMDDLGGIALRMRDPLPVLARIGSSEVENVRTRIRSTKISPWGEDWAPWRPSTRAYRERKGNAAQGLLWDRSDLLRSIRYETQINVENLSVVDIGTDFNRDGAPVGLYLQDGTEKMDARPYLGWNDVSFNSYEQMLMAWVMFGDERA